MRHYPKARLHGMHWLLVEARDRVLPEIDEVLADYAVRELKGRGIDIRLNTTLSEVTADAARRLLEAPGTVGLGLGILALLHAVPVALGAAHQAGAVIVLTLALATHRAAQRSAHSVR